jgi:hypothetical protein
MSDGTSSRARHPIPKQKAPFRMLFPVEILAAFLAKLLGNICERVAGKDRREDKG